MTAFHLALQVDPADNVATIFAEGITDGTQVEVRDPSGRGQVLCVIGDIPYGHKIALTDIPQGAPIIKYGHTIGAASRAIRAGEYVHIHNLEALRGRGDWSREG